MLGVSLKLYLDITRTTDWSRAVRAIVCEHPATCSGTVRLFVLPSLTALPVAQIAFADTPVQVGAQDLHWEDRGAFTGATSGEDLRSVGCHFVEVGHAERRRVFGEGDEIIGRKLAAAFRNDLIPVLCVGERQELATEAAVTACLRQLNSAIDYAGAHIDGGELVVAYEPEWAIGRAEPAAPEHIRTVAAALRARLAEDSRLRAGWVIYGGSAQRGTLTALGQCVDGLFLGRFAHEPADLAHILDEAAKLT